MCKPSTARWVGRQRGTVLGHWIFHQLLKIAGRDLAGAGLIPVTAYYWLFSPAGRKASRIFLQTAAAYWQWKKTPAVYTHLLSFAQVLLDRACMFSKTGGNFRFTYAGEHFIREAAARGQGVILLSAHAGNWEAAGSLLRERVSSRFSVAMVGAEANRLNAYLQQKQNPGLNIINLDAADGSLQILAALRQGQVVAMHGDRFLPGARTQRVKFMGAAAAFPEGPFQLAALAGCPVITCFALRTGPRRYAFQAFPPETLSPQPDRRGREVGEALQQYAARLEAVVRKAPLQWFNFYDFWA